MQLAQLGIFAEQLLHHSCTEVSAQQIRNGAADHQPEVADRKPDPFTKPKGRNDIQHRQRKDDRQRFDGKQRQDACGSQENIGGRVGNQSLYRHPASNIDAQQHQSDGEDGRQDFEHTRRMGRIFFGHSSTSFAKEVDTIHFIPKTTKIKCLFVNLVQKSLFKSKMIC